MKNVWIWGLPGLGIAAAILAGVGTPHATAAVATAWQDDAAMQGGMQDDAATQDEAAKADDDLETLDEDGAKAKVAEMKAEWAKAIEEFSQAFSQASAEERVKMRDQRPDANAYAEKFQKLADRFPKSDVAAESLVWIAMQTRAGKNFEDALDRLLADHLDYPELTPVLTGLGFQNPSVDAEKRFKTIFEKAQEKSVLGVTHYAYLQYQKRLQRVQKMASDPANAGRLDQLKATFGEDGLAYIRAYKMASEEEQIAALEKIAADYGEVEVRPGMSLGKLLEGEIFEAKYLRVGLVAPDIEGEDVEGTAFKLSDYRGKVVVIDFWGDW